MIVLHGQIMVAGKPQRQVDTGIRTTSLRLQRRQEPSIERQEEFVVVYFGVWWEILIEVISEGCQTFKNFFLVLHKRGPHCSKQKVDVYGWKKYCNINKVNVEMKYEAMCGQF